MSAGKCARCDKTVYPVEGLRCLDKIWHKGCFKCQECNMTLNMKNYKGFEKRPYCNAHCPQAKATTVADTPEIRRLAENTRIQSQAKYHEDFEKSKGKGFTTVLDDPEMRRIKETSKIISNVAYHGELERKKQMEEKRDVGGQEECVAINNNNNNNVKHQNKMQSSNKAHHPNEHLTPSHQAQQYQQHQHQQRVMQQQQQQQHQQQQQQQQIQQQHQMQQQQQQQYLQKQQMLLKQQQQQYNAQNRQSAPVEGHQQQVHARNVQPQQPYPGNNHTQLQHQQQMLMRQQQQIVMQQQHRQSMDPSIPMSRQTSKQAIITNSHPLMKHPNMVQAQNQAQIKYVPVTDTMTGQPIPPHLIGMPSHMVNHPSQIGAMQQQNNRRVVGNHPQQVGGQQQHHMINNYGSQPIGSVNGVMPKQSAASMGNMQLPHHMIPHPDHMHPLQMRPASFAGQPMHQPIPNQVPRRVFRAMYDYVANDVDEVSFFENDILIDCVNVDRNWLIGKVARSGQTGMLPANYVAELPSQ